MIKVTKKLPYTYQAKVHISEGIELYNYYIADTICGLINYLEKHDIEPDGVEIREVFNKEEKLLSQDYFVSEGKWIHTPEVCNSFKEHYKGHICDKGCSFEGRDQTGIGP